MNQCVLLNQDAFVLVICIMYDYVNIYPVTTLRVI